MLIDWLDDELKDYVEFQAFLNAVDPEIDRIYQAVRQLQLNLNPNTADRDGISYFEEAYSIKPGKNDSLEERRYRVLAKLNARLPYTEVSVKRFLNELLGEGKYQLSIKNQELVVTLLSENVNKAKIVYELLNEIVPMNISLKANYIVEIRVKDRLFTTTRERRIITIPINNDRKTAKAYIGTPYRQRRIVKPHEVTNV